MTDLTTPASEIDPDAPVSLVIHRPLAEANYAVYEEWQRKVGARLASWPGFIDREIVRPNPPVQTDFVIVQHFANAEAARSWLQSDERRALHAEIEQYFVGNDDVHLFTDEKRHPSETASVIISSHVEPELETEFLAWQRQISSAESRFEGFLGHRVERPVTGVQDDWVVILSFDTDAHLTKWIESPERIALLKEGERFNEQMKVTRSSYGFGFWSRNNGPDPDPVFKSNLLVLLMLYPIVFLWGYFIGDTLLKPLPFWLALFIGNVVSTQLLGWVFVPWAFKRFRWWMKRNIPVSTNVLGYAIVIALYIISMAVYALLLALRG